MALPISIYCEYWNELQAWREDIREDKVSGSNLSDVVRMRTYRKVDSEAFDRPTEIPIW